MRSVCEIVFMKIN